MTFKINDTVRWVDDPHQIGTVLKISDQVRRDGLGFMHPDLPPMVYVQWETMAGTPGRKRWTAPELLRKV